MPVARYATPTDIAIIIISVAEQELLANHKAP
jgi:hypothetical protein